MVVILFYHSFSVTDIVTLFYENVLLYYHFVKLNYHQTPAVYLELSWIISHPEMNQEYRYITFWGKKILGFLYCFYILHLRPILALFLMCLPLNYQTFLQISPKCYQTFLQNYPIAVLIKLFSKIYSFVSKLSNFITSGHLPSRQTPSAIKMGGPVTAVNIGIGNG